MPPPITKTFRSKMYGDLYRFRYEFDGEFWIIFIEEHPPNPRGGSAFQTHILPGNRVCISSGYEPKTFEQAVSRSWSWIAHFSNYIRTGSTEQKKTRAITPDYDDHGNVS